MTVDIEVLKIAYSLAGDNGHAPEVRQLIAESEQLQTDLNKANEENKRLREELKRKEIAHHHYKKEVKP